MKKSIILSCFLFFALLSNAQMTKTQAQFSIDSLLPSASAVQMVKVRAAFAKALNFAEPNTVDLLKAGANPNGTTNTTAAVVAAFATGKKVYVPKGTYLVNAPITITNNVECEKGAVFKVANGYVGDVFLINSQKAVYINGLYVDALGTGIRTTGLKIQGSWNSNVLNYSFVASNTDTSSIGLDLYSSSSGALKFGNYTVSVDNPYISGGKYGIRAQKTASDSVDVTHLGIRGGWITNQKNSGVLLKNTFSFYIFNTAFDYIASGTIGIKLENCHEGYIMPGEYNSGVLLNIDNASDKIHLQTSKSLNLAAAVVGTHYSAQTAGVTRLNPTVDAGYQTNIEARYDANTPFRVVGNYYGSDFNVLSYHITNGFIPHILNPQSNGSNIVGVNSSGGLVKVSARKMLQGTVAPTTGTWEKGDYCENYDPDPGEYFGWVCVVAGSPGVWKGYGIIQN